MISGDGIALGTPHISGLPCWCSLARRMMYELYGTGISATDSPILTSLVPSRRRPAKVIRSTILARLWCRDGLNAPAYLQKPKQPRPLKLLPRQLWILVHDPTILLYPVGTLCFHVLGVSARQFTNSSVSYILYTLSDCSYYCWPFLERPIVIYFLLSLFSLPLLVALLCITNLRFQFMMGVCIAIVFRP